jgi:hypothetical protein
MTTKHAATYVREAQFCERAALHKAEMSADAEIGNEMRNEARRELEAAGFHWIRAIVLILGGNVEDIPRLRLLGDVKPRERVMFRNGEIVVVVRHDSDMDGPFVVCHRPMTRKRSADDSRRAQFDGQTMTIGVP